MDDLQVKGGVSLDDLIKEVSQHIGRQWKSLARAMKLTKTDIDAIEYRDERDLKEQICQLFNTWKQQKGEDATSKALLDAIKDAELNDVIKDLLDNQYITRKPNSAALSASLAAGARASGVQQRTVVGDERLNSSPVISPEELEREHIRQKRLERFSSSDQSNISENPKNPVTQDAVSSTERDSTVRTKSSKTPLSEDSPFGVDDCIKISWSDGNPRYGVIKWLGKQEISGAFMHTAGLEMEETVEGGHDGTFNGNQYFTCDYGLGLLLPVERLQRDDRFEDLNSSPQRQGSPEPSLNQLDVDESPRNEASGSSFTPNVSIASPGTTNEVSPMQKLIDVFNGSRSTPPTTRHRNSDSDASNQGSNQLVFYIPKDRTGLVIGREGKNVQEVERETNTSIKITTAFNGNGKGTIIGSEENCKKALLLILTNLKRRVSQQLATTETITIPNREMAGRVIGKKGCNKKAIEAISGAKIRIIEGEGITSLLSDERQCKITGSAEQIEVAKEVIGDAMRGVDVAEAAFFAAMLVKLVTHFEEMGFEFPDNI